MTIHSIISVFKLTISIIDVVEDCEDCEDYLLVVSVRLKFILRMSMCAKSANKSYFKIQTPKILEIQKVDNLFSLPL